MKIWGWVGLSFGWVAGCGNELELPIEHPPSPDADAGPSSGITGLAGAPEHSEPPRLPVSDSPLFGAAGADAGAEGGGAGAAEVSRESGAGGEPLDRGGSSSSGGRGGSGSGGKGGSGSGGKGGSGSGGNAGGGGKPPALLLTEYVEGSGSLKALEIYAISAGSLEGCELETYFNGKLVPGKLALHGDLAVGQTYVLSSATLATAQPQLCSRSTNLTFNGDDALALTCAGKTLDVIGQLGVDPGEGWGNGATVDHTLRRRCEVSSGRLDGTMPFDPALEWTSFAADTFADLGKRTCP